MKNEYKINEQHNPAMNFRLFSCDKIESQSCITSGISNSWVNRSVTHRKQKNWRSMPFKSFKHKQTITLKKVVLSTFNRSAFPSNWSFTQIISSICLSVFFIPNVLWSEETMKLSMMSAMRDVKQKKHSASALPTSKRKAERYQADVCVKFDIELM